MWRVEGLLVLHLILPIVVVIMRHIKKLVLIRRWQSSVQGGNPIDDSINVMFLLLKSCVSGRLVLHEYLAHHLHHGSNLFVANTFILFVSRRWWWWRRLSLFWWHCEQKTESNSTIYRLVKQMQDQRWKHKLSQASYPALMSCSRCRSK
jgi:hypothetical protein